MKSLSISQMENLACGKREEAIGCALIMEIAGIPWEVGASIANPLAGIAVDLGWTVLTGWVCSHI